MQERNRDFLTEIRDHNSAVDTRAIDSIHQGK